MENKCNVTDCPEYCSFLDEGCELFNGIVDECPLYKRNVYLSDTVEHLGEALQHLNFEMLNCKGLSIGTIQEVNTALYDYVDYKESNNDR